MTDNASFKDFLKEYADIKNQSVKKLSDSTGIPERYVEALFEGNSSDLPPAPYVRGYIGKLAEALDFDRDEMWRLFKRDLSLDVAASNLDRLPINRYAIKRVDKKFIAGGIVILLVIAYAGWNFNKFLGNPRLELTYPSSESLVVAQPFLSVEGRADPDNKLTINDTEIFVDEDGRFRQDLTLDAGLNIISVKAKKFLGKEAILIREIIYQAPAEIVSENIEDAKEK